ncbi:MAG TPA: hypothetical protein VFV67_28740 [Actinophytocola sp.]|nr:hypothetical protein [Actinophytocola sp.]HEU5474654.1 hypothetical protein [Actinophytocola sp.]
MGWPAPVGGATDWRNPMAQVKIKVKVRKLEKLETTAVRDNSEG